MSSLFFDDGVAWFTIPALVGTGVFVIKLLLMFAGGDIAGLDTDLDAHHGDSTAAFKLLSIQAIAAFAMGFGWGGVAAMRGLELGWPASLVTAVACGAGMVWLLTALLGVVHRMQRSGNIGIDRTVGLEGSVYVTVPPAGAGRGQVRVTVEDRQRIYTAVNEGAEAIPTGVRVRVVRANPNNTITVVRA